MTDLAWFIIALVGGATFAGAYTFGRQASSLARMELVAAVQVAKQEVGWEYQRYRIEALRMDWVALDVAARKEYVRQWGRPRWAGSEDSPDPLEGVAVVRSIRGPVQ